MIGLVTFGNEHSTGHNCIRDAKMGEKCRNFVNGTTGGVNVFFRFYLRTGLTQN